MFVFAQPSETLRKKEKKMVRAACMKSESLCLAAHLTVINVLPNGTSQTVSRALATSMNFNDVKRIAAIIEQCS